MKKQNTYCTNCGTKLKTILYTHRKGYIKLPLYDAKTGKRTTRDVCPNLECKEGKIDNCSGHEYTGNILQKFFDNEHCKFCGNPKPFYW